MRRTDMKNAEIIFFDNTNDCSKYDNAKHSVYESFRDGQDWTSIDEVPAYACPVQASTKFPPIWFGKKSPRRTRRTGNILAAR